MRSRPHRWWWRATGLLVAMCGVGGFVVWRVSDPGTSGAPRSYVIGQMTVRFDDLAVIYQALATVEVFHVERIVATPGATTIEEYVRHRDHRTSYRTDGPKRRLEAVLSAEQTVFKPGRTAPGFAPRWLGVRPAAAAANSAVAASLAEELSRYLPQVLVQRMEPVATGYRLVGASGTVSADLVFAQGRLAEMFIVGVDGTSRAWPAETALGVVDGPILTVDATVAAAVFSDGTWSGAITADPTLVSRQRAMTLLDTGSAVMGDLGVSDAEVLAALQRAVGTEATVRRDGHSDGVREIGYQSVAGQWRAVALRGGDGRCYVRALHWPNADAGYAVSTDQDCLAGDAHGTRQLWTVLLEAAS